VRLPKAVTNGRFSGVDTMATRAPRITVRLMPSPYQKSGIIGPCE
jgi:hypothetical protein